MKQDGEQPPESGLTPAQFWHYYQRYPYLLAKVALWGAVLAGVYWAIMNVEAVLFPLLVSMLTAYLLDPAVDWLEEICGRVPFINEPTDRLVAIGVFLFIILLALVGFILILYPAIATQVSKVGERIPELITLFQTKLVPWVQQKLGYQLPADLSEAMAAYGTTIQEQLPKVAQKASAWVGSLVTQTGAIVASLINLVMIPFFTFYFLRDFDRMKVALKEYVPEAHRERYLSRMRMMDEVVGAWFRGQVTVALILAFLYALGFGIVFGIAGIGSGTGIAIGILAGVLNIIPYFGVLIGTVLAALMVLLDWSGVWPLIAVLGVTVGIQNLEGWFITPKIVGDKVGLSPVVVIIVLLLGGELFGLLGVLLAIPVAGIVRVMLPDLVSYYKRTPFYSGNYSSDEAIANAIQGGSVGPREASRIVPLDEDEVSDSEATDGTVAEEELSEEEPAPQESKDAHSPVTGSDARTTDRDKSVTPPLDEGTDGVLDDAEADDGTDHESRDDDDS
jgi:predicted PurR-regulated permease PerM